MAILQRTLVSGSIWIGTSSSVQYLGNYQDSHHLPLAIYKNSDAVFNFNTQGTTNVLYLNTSSIRSANYQSGFDPTNQGNRGFAIDLIDNRYVAQFDDLWVRGTMNVHQFVINQIRATNGSLWVSDAAKATSASSTSLGLVLQFESGSALPFVQGDIIRSKRWVVTQTQVQNWDIITVVNSINYTDCYLTGSLVGTTYWTASPQSLGNLTQSAGSDWVRIGHTSSTTGRQGGIYLTAGDKNSPYIDIYDSVSNVAGGHYNDSGSVDYTVNNVLKARLGKLTGISDVAFGGSLQGYGLYADNAYLRGWIVANQGGNIAGWTINPGTLSNKDMRLVASNYESYLAVKTQIYAGEGIWIGTSSAGARLSIGGANDNFLRWTGTQLQIKTANFSMSNGNVSMSGTVSATTGKIGGWTIGTNQLYSGLVTISSLSTNKYFGIGASGYNTVSSIYLGSNSVGSQFSIRGTGTTGLYWDGTNLGVSTSNFTLSQGNITAKNAVISGSISSSAGQIGGWSIKDQWLQNSSSNALIRLSTTSSYWDLINSQGVFNYDTSSHPQMYSLFTSSYDGFNTQVNQWGTTSIATGSFIQEAGGKPSQVYIQYTASYGNNRELLFYINTNSSAQIIVPPKQTIFYSLEIRRLEASIIGGIGTGTPVELWSVMYTASGYQKGSKQNSEYFIGAIGEYTDSVIISSYTNPSQTQTKVMSLGIYSRVKSDSGTNYKVAFTMSNVFVNSIKSVTQLSDKGLFLFAGPNKFLKISSDPTVPGSTQQYAVASLDRMDVGKLYIGGAQVRLGESGSIGGGIGGDGTVGYIPMFQDDTTIEDSSMYENESMIYSEKPIGSATFTGSGFVFTGTNTALSSVGNITSGQDLSNLSIKQILEAMLIYAKPTLTAPGLTEGGSSYYYETGSTIGADGTINKGSSKITNCANLMPGTGLTMSFVRNNESVTLGSTSVTSDNTYTVNFNMTAETGSYNSSHATSVKATITNSKGVVTQASRTIFFRAPVFAFTNTQSSFTDVQFVTAIRSDFSTKIITKTNLAKGETYTTPANSSGGTVQAYLAWPASWKFKPTSMKMYGNPCGATLISSTMGYTSSVNPDAKLQYKLLAVGDPQTNPAALSLYIDEGEEIN